MHRFVEIDGVNLHLAQPHDFDSQWIGQGEILKQLLACWLVVGERDLPLTPRLVGSPGIGKTALGMAAAKVLGRELYIYQCTADTRPEDLLAGPRRERQDRLSRLAAGHGDAPRRRLPARRR